MWEWTSFATSYTNSKGFLIFKTPGYIISDLLFVLMSASTKG